MPYDIRKVKGGWVVVSTETGKKHSKHPLSEATAKAQMRAMYMAMSKGEKKATHLK